MRTFDFDPDHAHALASDLLHDADRTPATPTISLSHSPAVETFHHALSRALESVDIHTRAVHDRARQLAQDSIVSIDAAVDTDVALATRLGRDW